MFLSIAEGFYCCAFRALLQLRSLKFGRQIEIDKRYRCSRGRYDEPIHSRKRHSAASARESVHTKQIGNAEM